MYRELGGMMDDADKAARLQASTLTTTAAEIQAAADTVVYGGKVYRKPSGWPWAMYVLYAAFLIAVFAIAGPWGVAVVLVLHILGRSLARKNAKQETSEWQAFADLCAEKKVQYKANYSDPKRGFLLALNEGDARVVAQYKSPAGSDKSTWAWRIIDAKRVLNVELAVNDQAVYKAGPVATLAGAALGGLTFGGFGAVTGALATGRAGAGRISTLTLKLRVDDIDEPLIEVPFILAPIKASDSEAKARLALAERWTNLIEVLRHRAA
jgi:hypothetical protein